MERIISAYDYYVANGGLDFDSREAASLQISIKSKDALDLFNKIADHWEIDADSRPTKIGQRLSYNSDDCSEGQVFYIEPSILDEVQDEFALNFGLPETETSPVFEFGYVQTTNEHWGVWTREVYVDEDGRFLRHEEY